MGDFRREKCEKCGLETSFPDAPDLELVCAVCKFLGDRSLVALLADPSPERLAKFRAATPGRLRDEREGRRNADGLLNFEGDPRDDRVTFR